MGKRATPLEVAQWMADQIEASGELYQEDAAGEIEDRFGSTHVYTNDNGNTAISKAVLNEFRRMTEKTVVWIRGERYWRRRSSSDDPGRQQDS